MKLPVIHTIDKRPQPLLTSAAVVSAVQSLSAALVFFGILPVALGDQINKAAVGVVGGAFTLVALVAPIVQALVSRKAVTPNSSPRNEQGEDLVPIGAVLAASAATIPAALAPNEEPALAAVADEDLGDGDDTDIDAAFAEADELFPHEAADDDDARPQPHRPRHLED